MVKNSIKLLKNICNMNKKAGNMVKPKAEWLKNKINTNKVKK